MNITDLKRVGLSDGEVKIYSALLDLGESTRTELAKKSGISPSKIYDVANRLLEKGIISVVKKNGVLHFSAATPERLKDFLQHKEYEIQHEKNLVAQLLPTLLAQYNEVKEKTDIEVFYGWQGMKTTFDDIANTLSKGDTNYIFGASQGLDQKQSDIFFSQYYKQVERKGYAVNIIFNENVRSNKQRVQSYSNHPKHKVRYLYQDTFTEFNFYKDTVLCIMLFKKPIIIRIKSKEAANSFKKFFETMWAEAKE